MNLMKSELLKYVKSRIAFIGIKIQPSNSLLSAAAAYLKDAIASYRAQEVIAELLDSLTLT